MESPQTRFRFNKRHIDGLPLPARRIRYRDDGVDGLILELAPSGTKTFRVYKKIKGQTSPVTVTLGKYPAMSIENARKQALDALNAITSGQNPNENERTKKLARMTLLEVYEDYIRVKSFSDSTLYSYKRNIKSYLKAYNNRALIKFTEEDVKKEHRRISALSPAQADATMRVLRALFNFAKYEYRGPENIFLFEHNPVHILSHQKLWNKVERRNTRLTKGQLPDWFNAVETIREEGDIFAKSVCDMVEMALLTGLRKNELLSLTWDRVNLEESTFFISTTKNGDRLELPISRHLHGLLSRRNLNKDTSPFVFNAPNKYGQIKEPKKVLIKIRELSGCDINLHDLRRTFTTTAEALNLGTYTIKRMLNHRTRRDDVTAGYTILTPEELREPAQKIEDRLLVQAGIKDPDESLDKKLALLIEHLSDEQKMKLVTSLTENLAEETKTSE